MLPGRQDGHTMIAQEAVDDDPVTGLHVTGMTDAAVPRVKYPDPGRVDEQLVAAAVLHHLGVAGDDGHPRFTGRICHRADHTFQFLQRQAFLQDERGTQRQRAPSRHREVVDRATHGQVADIAPGKEERAHHVRVGGKDRHPRRQIQQGRIGLSREHFAAEMLHEHVADQFLRHPAATAVPE